jgi:hypothetical protein
VKEVYFIHGCVANCLVFISPDRRTVNENPPQPLAHISIDFEYGNAYTLKKYLCFGLLVETEKLR